MKNYQKFKFITVLKKILFSIVLLLILQGCSDSYSGKTYYSENSKKYIKFINSNIIEWKWNTRFPPEEFEYTIEGNQIRTVRRLFGQTEYLEILDNDKIQDNKGSIYSQE